MTKEIFKHLFDTYFDAVRSYLYYRGASMDDATDIAQEVFMRLWEKQMNVNELQVKYLLYKMAGDIFISQYRHKIIEAKYISYQEDNQNDYTPEDELSHKELVKKYNQALSELNEKQRTVFLMSRMEGLKYQEIAERLNLSVKAVEKRMSLALNQLKQALNHYVENR